jgi:signal peptidase I
MEGGQVALTGDPTTDTGSQASPGVPSAASSARAASARASSSGGSASAESGRSGDRPRSPARRIAVLICATGLVLALVRSLLVQSFVVPTASMSPTVHPGDRVLVSRLAYTTGKIKRGDVIVFDGSGVFESDIAPARSGLASFGRTIAAGFGLPIGSHDYLKRVIGLPGERVVCCDVQGRLTVDGVALDEPYINSADAPSTVRFDIVVPPGRLWVLGDHRSDSADSRAHLGDPGGGTVPVGRVVGRVTGIYWPLSHVGGIVGVPAKEVAGAAVGSSIGKDQR